MNETKSGARPSKEVAAAFVRRLAPQYAELLIAGQRNGGRIEFPENVRRVLNWTAPLVTFYEDDGKLQGLLAFGLLGAGGIKEWRIEIEAIEPGDESRYLDEIVNDEEFEAALEDFRLPETEEEWELARENLKALPETEREATVTRSYAFFGGMFGGFFNLLAVMVHGAKLTTLVSNAIGGHEESFLKAAQIDRRLIVHHPYFREKKERAQDEGNKNLLAKIAYRETNPVLRGKVRYPALYMVFAMLDGMRWLDEMPHGEMLDICVEAKLDRFQNRIDDVNYLTKRLQEYRRWQKSRGVSMH